MNFGALRAVCGAVFRDIRKKRRETLSWIGTENYDTKQTT